MRTRHPYVLLTWLLAPCAVVLVYAWPEGAIAIGSYKSVDRPVRIQPDYSGTTIPPNIAPLNFRVCEPGTHYCVRIHSRQGPGIEIFSRSPNITIPRKPWRRLLALNRSDDLQCDVLVQNADGSWVMFPPIINHIAAEDIDPFLVYRRMHPTHYLISGEVGLYQRDLRNYDETLVLKNKYYKQGGCVNCHTFCNHRTEAVLIAIRSACYGNCTLLIDHNDVRKIGAKFTYGSWHPSGRLAVFSINNVRQVMHAARDEVREAMDIDSTMVYYLVDSQTVKTAPQFSRKDRLETYPTWTPDGRFLYFCSAPKLWHSKQEEPTIESYRQVRYDLMRLSYDLEHDTWGEPETVLSAQATNMTALLPRISPDGRWLLLCMGRYGCFPAFQQESDLYLVDLRSPGQSGQYTPQRLTINSDRSESWHSWASNSRWIAFSSKRRDGVFTRVYLSYVDQAGQVHKPILLPQKDPTFFDSCLEAFNTPELVTQPVRPTGERLARAVRSSDRIAVEMPITMATPSAAKPAPAWQQRE